MLEDLLRNGLRLVICGTAAGLKSAHERRYYAGQGNCFWKVLYETGITGDTILQPVEYRRLLNYGVGLTDLAKNVAGNDRDVVFENYYRDELRAKIIKFRPRVLGFNGKKAASVFLGRPTRKIEYGRQFGRIAETAIWVLPSTSAAARAHWNCQPWRRMADLLMKVLEEP
jgi:double-stranded uracil-DNA glycosylase